MTRYLFFVLGAGFLAAFVCGCATDSGLAGRIREKQTLYGSLQPWEKLKIDCGTPALGFTPDLVHLAMGAPSKIVVDVHDGSELWIYDPYYPLIDSAHVFNPTSFTIEPAVERKKGAAFAPVAAHEERMSGKFHGASSLTDLRSYRCLVLFKEGTVVGLKALPNVD